ncbi:MAG: DUF2497 domain-containing protein [Alphaproteobacteria bacterium]
MDENLNTTDPTNASMQQILQSIRGVISGDETLSEKEDEVLELTEVVNEDGSISSLSPAQSTASSSSNDVLSNIDNALGITNSIPASIDNDSNFPSTAESSSTPQTNESIDDLFNTPSPSVETIDQKLEEIDKSKISNTEIASENTAKTSDNHSELGTSSEISLDQNSTNSDISKNLENLQTSTEEAIKVKSRLISDQAANVSSEALKMLVKTVSKPITDGLAFRSGTTLEDLVIELMKPYLSNWLDTNLPNIVKHLVEKEIQKLIPKDED